MDTYHRISFGRGNDVASKLDALGCDYIRTSGLNGNFMATLEIYESDPIWLDVYSLTEQYKSSDLSHTVFSKEEILKAEWLSVSVVFNQGYPQPEKAWLKNKPNYANYCRKCGTFKQVDSFQLKKEPYLRKNVFFSLLWASTLFARNSVFNTLREHNLAGYERWDAIIHKTRQPSMTVAQLRASNTTQRGFVNTSELPATTCAECGITKYMPHQKGIMYYRRDAMPIDIDIVDTQEWFGDGHMAYHELFVSQRFAEIAIREMWKGIRLNVVELV